MSNAQRQSSLKQRVENWQHLINAYHEAKRPENYNSFRLEINGRWGSQMQSAYEQMADELGVENGGADWKAVLKKLKENSPNGTPLTLGKSYGSGPGPAPRIIPRTAAAEAPAASEQPATTAPATAAQTPPAAPAPTAPAVASTPATAASAAPTAAPASTAPIAPAASAAASAGEPQASAPAAAASAASAEASQPTAKPAPVIAAASATAAHKPEPATGDKEHEGGNGLNATNAVVGVSAIAAAAALAAASVAAYRAHRSNGAETTAPEVTAEGSDEPARTSTRRNGATAAATTEAVTPQATTVEVAKPAARTPAQPGTQRPVTRIAPKSDTTTPAAAPSTNGARDIDPRHSLYEVSAPSIAPENTEPSLKYPDPVKGYKGTIEMNAIPDGILFTDSGGKYQRPTDRHKNHDAIVAGSTEFADPHASQHGMLKAAAEAADKLAPSLTDKNSGSTFTAATWKDGKIWTTHVGDSPAWVMEITAEGKVIPHLINGKFFNESPFTTHIIDDNLGGPGWGEAALTQLNETPERFRNSMDFSKEMSGGNRFVLLAGTDGLLDHIGVGLGSMPKEAAKTAVQQQIDAAGERYATLIEKHVAEGRSLNDPQLAVRINDAATDMHGQSKAKKDPNYLTNPKNKDNTTFALVELGSKEVTVVVADGNYDDGKSIATKVADVARRHLQEPFAPEKVSASKVFKEIAHQDIAATQARKAAEEAASKATQHAATAEPDAAARTAAATAETGHGASTKPQPAKGPAATPKGATAAPAEGVAGTTARGAAINGAGTAPGGTKAALANQPLPAADAPVVGTLALKPEVVPARQLAPATVNKVDAGKAAAANDATATPSKTPTAGSQPREDRSPAVPAKNKVALKGAISPVIANELRGGLLGAVGAATAAAMEAPRGVEKAVAAASEAILPGSTTSSNDVCKLTGTVAGGVGGTLAAVGAGGAALVALTPTASPLVSAPASIVAGGAAYSITQPVVKQGAEVICNALIPDAVKQAADKALTALNNIPIFGGDAAVSQNARNTQKSEGKAK